MPPYPMAFPGSDKPKPVPKQAKSAPVLVVVEPYRACDQGGYSSDGMPIERAQFQIETVNGSLYFCGHHFWKNSEAIFSAGYPIQELHTGALILWQHAGQLSQRSDLLSQA